MTDQQKPALEEAKKFETDMSNIVEASGTIKAVTNAALGVLSGGITGNIVKGVVLLLGFFVFFFIKRGIKKVRRENAAKLSEQEAREHDQHRAELNSRSNGRDIDDLELKF